ADSAHAEWPRADFRLLLDNESPSLSPSPRSDQLKRFRDRKIETCEIASFGGHSNRAQKSPAIVTGQNPQPKQRLLHRTGFQSSTDSARRPQPEPGVQTSQAGGSARRSCSTP